MGPGPGLVFDPAGWLFFEAGFRPGGRLPFLSRDKKGSKEARPKLSTTLRFAAGDLRWQKGEAGGSQQPEMQNSRCAIVALGCFSWAEATASGLGLGGVAQEIDLVFHVGGQPLGAVLNGAQGVGHHVRVAQAFGR